MTAPLEASPFIGGISRTIERNGNRFDIGPHRFFSKSEEVKALWKAANRYGVKAIDSIGSAFLGLVKIQRLPFDTP